MISILRVLCIPIAMLCGLCVKVLFMHYGMVGDDTSNFFGCIAFAGVIAGILLEMEIRSR